LTNKKLMIISASSRLIKEPTKPLPAIERYDGVYFRVLRKSLREGKLRNIDILVLSEKFGLVWASNKIPFHEPHPGAWGSLSLSKKDMNKLRKENLQKVKKIITRYSEIYVNVGRKYFKLIEGFEKFTTCQITYAIGKGLGPKASHMKEWVTPQ